MATMVKTQPKMAEADQLQDAKTLRQIATDPARTKIDWGVACYIVNRHVTLGNLGEEDPYTLSLERMADKLEGGAK